MSYELDDDVVYIRVPGAKSMIFYPSTDCPDLENLIKDGVTDSDTLSLRLKSPGLMDLVGRLEVHDDAGRTTMYDLIPHEEMKPTLNHKEDSP